MNLSSAARYLLLVGYVAAVTIDLKKACQQSSYYCTIADCNEEQLVISSEETFNFTELIFRNCYLPSIPSTVFSQVPTLERILLYKCSLKSIQPSSFTAARNLRSLNLPNNRLSELPEKVFQNLTNVKEIRLASNHISRIHSKAFKGLTQLRVLELNNNKIHELAASVFGNLTNLEYIDLSFNDLEEFDSKVFETNSQLKTILLSSNNFAIFDSNSLAHLPHLHMLDISNNVINAIRLQSVDTLRAQSSQLRSCVINGSVIRVRASNNQLESISITDKSSVQEIDVHNNQFESLSDFDGMSNLQKLNVSKNSIRRLYMNNSLLLDLPSLQYLNVANCQLKALSTENFLLLDKLLHLDLGYNNIHLLDASTFEPLDSLEKIFFEGNHLHLFEYETFLRNHANVREMGIFGNDWTQSYLKKMSDVLKANNVKLVSRMRTSEASELQQTTNHPHHTVHAKTLYNITTTSRAQGIKNPNILIIITLCFVLLILVLQLFRILKEENVFALFTQGIRRTVRRTRLNEEESEAL